MEIEKVMFDYNIRPQELRYKNLVTYEGETIEIDGINGREVTCKEVGVLPFAHIRPLVITEALLFKAGFDVEETIGLRKIYWLRNNFRCELLANGQVAIYYTYEKTKISYCQFIHQIQNIYFDLTNIELNFIL